MKMDKVNTNTESETVEETVSEQPQAEGTPEGQPQQVVLLGAISYTDEANYEQFLHSMDINKALFVLSSAANFAQSKGTYSVAEAELISCATRAIRKSSTPVANIEDDANAAEPTTTGETSA